MQVFTCLHHVLKGHCQSKNLLALWKKIYASGIWRGPAVMSIFIFLSEKKFLKMCKKNCMCGVCSAAKVHSCACGLACALDSQSEHNWILYTQPTRLFWIFSGFFSHLRMWIWTWLLGHLKCHQEAFFFPSRSTYFYWSVPLSKVRMESFCHTVVT